MAENPSMTSPEEAGFPTKQVLPIFALVFVDVLGLTIILPLLHLYAAVYGASPFEIGLTAAAFPLAQLVGVPLMGALSDRFGRKPLLLISQITTFAGFIMLGLANSLTLVILSRVLDGLFGANLSTAQAALSDITTRQNRARALGLIGAAFGIGFLIGPAISALTLEFTGSLSIPAFIAAIYSFISILLTLFLFKETLPPEQRAARAAESAPRGVLRPLANPQLRPLLLLMFAQQLAFFMFETLLGLFVLTRLGLLGQGTALLFIYVGIILVIVQVRYLGKWVKRYGERRIVYAALALLAVGLLLVAATPDQAHPLYLRQRAEADLRESTPSSVQAVTGLAVELPENGRNGIIGIGWFLVAVIPLAIGSGLIRPNLNSLMTQRAGGYGAILGWSAAAVSAADAAAPILGGLLFQVFGASVPFLLGGLLMAGLYVLARALIQPDSEERAGTAAD